MGVGVDAANMRQHHPNSKPSSVCFSSVIDTHTHLHGRHIYGHLETVLLLVVMVLPSHFLPPSPVIFIHLLLQQNLFLHPPSYSTTITHTHTNTPYTLQATTHNPSSSASQHPHNNQKEKMQVSPLCVGVCVSLPPVPPFPSPPFVTKV